MKDEDMGVIVQVDDLRRLVSITETPEPGIQIAGPKGIWKSDAKGVEFIDPPVDIREPDIRINLRHPLSELDAEKLLAHLRDYLRSKSRKAPKPNCQICQGTGVKAIGGTPYPDDETCPCCLEKSR